MAQEVSIIKSICRFEPRNFAVGVLIACFVITFSYFTMVNFDSFHFFVVNSASKENVATHRIANSEKLDVADTMNSKASPIFSKHATTSEESIQSIVQEIDSDIKEEIKDNTEICNKKPELCKAGKDTASSKPSISPKQQGDVRINGRNATVMWVPSPESDDGPNYERKVWHIKPYPRKEDPRAMDPVRMVTVKSVNSPDEAPSCTNHSDLPAIVFSDRGYEDNYFHDFTDVLVPMFTTARRFQGEVIFLVSDLTIYRIAKYVRVYKNLTKYDLINFDCDEEVRCYKKVYVGLTSHMDFDIDPERIPERYTLVDFTRFMRSIYGLKRDTVEIPVPKTLGRKPRLIIVARAKTRRFVNLDDIIDTAERLGFEVVATEATDGLDRFSLVVNSCDVMMGVHGAGLSNMVFLPSNSVFIQILPWGDLQWIGDLIKRPAERMKLKYIQYDITPEESTLIEQYPINHAAFTDPASIQRNGWGALKEVFLDKQNVRLDIERFKPTLKKALEHLNSEHS
ncbi:EGF domain-specific O-linked [Carex littledalei]|uniref:EGF domain-specific O-linked n=1 Tax=Carex littledalei TaxID=544730 RepID=A0A833VWK4_9POAL|nr:EGF domain-specific O-linked [Carex littledalei]